MAPPRSAAPSRGRERVDGDDVTGAGRDRPVDGVRIEHRARTKKKIRRQCRRNLGDELDGIVGEAELHVLEAHDRLVLTHEGVLRLAEDLDERAFVQLAQRRDDGQASARPKSAGR